MFRTGSNVDDELSEMFGIEKADLQLEKIENKALKKSQSIDESFLASNDPRFHL